MVLFDYHASHEQFPPSALVRYVRLAEQAGFTAVSSAEMFPDRFRLALGSGEALNERVIGE